MTPRRSLSASLAIISSSSAGDVIAARPNDGSGVVPRDDANAAGFADVSASEADQAAPNVIPTHPNIAGITLRPGVRYRRMADVARCVTPSLRAMAVAVGVRRTGQRA